MSGLRYKGYEGSAEMDFERGVCHGRIRFIDDLVTYEASNPKLLQEEFEAAVDDYLETCKELGRPPKKPASGLFNVRTTPEKHAALATKALRERRSLNAVVNEAFDLLLTTGGREQVPSQTVVVATYEFRNWMSAGTAGVHLVQQLQESDHEPSEASYAPSSAPALDIIVPVSTQAMH